MGTRRGNTANSEGAVQDVPPAACSQPRIGLRCPGHGERLGRVREARAICQKRQAGRVVPVSGTQAPAARPGSGPEKPEGSPGALARSGSVLFNRGGNERMAWLLAGPGFSDGSARGGPGRNRGCALSEHQPMRGTPHDSGQL